METIDRDKEMREWGTDRNGKTNIKDGTMAEESKITLRIGIIATGIASLIVFVLGTLFVHQTDIATLKVTAANNIQNIADVKSLLREIRDDQIRRERKEGVLEEKLMNHIGRPLK